jgi:hypothetical protein
MTCLRLFHRRIEHSPQVITKLGRFRRLILNAQKICLRMWQERWYTKGWKYAMLILVGDDIWYDADANSRVKITFVRHTVFDVSIYIKANGSWNERFGSTSGSKVVDNRVSTYWEIGWRIGIHGRLRIYIKKLVNKTSKYTTTEKGLIRLTGRDDFCTFDGKQKWTDFGMLRKHRVSAEDLYGAISDNYRKSYSCKCHHTSGMTPAPGPKSNQSGLRPGRFLSHSWYFPSSFDLHITMQKNVWWEF